MIEQIAVSCKKPNEAKAALALLMSASVVATDSGGAMREDSGSPTPLSLNYRNGGFELQLIVDCDAPVELNLGFHIENPAQFEAVLFRIRSMFSIASETKITIPALAEETDSRQYRHVVFGSCDDIGFDLKITQRLNIDGTPYVQSNVDRIVQIRKEAAELEIKMIALESEERHLEIEVLAEDIAEFG